jgi:peptide chain release factor subunit 1
MTTSTEYLAPQITRQNDNILSVYLNTNQTDASNLNRGFETQLAASLNDIERTLRGDELEKFLVTSHLIRQFTRLYQPTGRGLVLFANPKGILHSRHLNIPIDTEIQWGRPHVKPYLEAIDEYERQVIVVTDKWHGKILSVFLGTVEANVEVRDQPNTTHLQTVGMDRLESQSRFQRKADENMKRHIRHLVAELQSVLEARPCRRIICGGNVEALAELFRILPKAVRERVAGTASMTFADNLDQLLKKALEVGLETERNHEAQNVEQLRVAAGKRGKATTGVPDTLAALREGRVRMLYYAEGVSLPGRLCSECSALFPEDVGETCEYCGKPLRLTSDIIDNVLLQAIGSSSDIEQVRGAGAEQLRATGGIGATLRY